MDEPEFGSGPFPRAPLLGAAALVLVTLIGVSAARISGIGVGQDPPAAIVKSSELRFIDQADGSVGVLDAQTDRVVTVLAPGTNGFVRSTVRGLVRERKRRGLGPDMPFRLSSRADGRLTLEDRATGRLVELDAFGATNTGAFARLLTSGTRAQTEGRAGS